MTKLTLILLSVLLFCSCAQSQKGVRSRGAYVMIRQPGMLPVDDAGNIIQSRPDSIFTVFAETGSKKVEWGIFWIGRKAYTVIPSRVERLQVPTGSEEQGGEAKSLTPSRGNKLWHLELTPYEKKLALPAASKPGQILMSGKYGTTPFSIAIAQVTVIKSPPAY